MKEFYVEIDNLVRENPEYTRDEAFTFWFINYLILDENHHSLVPQQELFLLV